MDIKSAQKCKKLGRHKSKKQTLNDKRQPKDEKCQKEELQISKHDEGEETTSKELNYSFGENVLLHESSFWRENDVKAVQIPPCCLNNDNFAFTCICSGNKRLVSCILKTGFHFL